MKTLKANKRRKERKEKLAEKQRDELGTEWEKTNKGYADWDKGGFNE